MPNSAVVRVFATTQGPDLDSPWQSDSPSSSTGSGVVVGRGQVLTGAHVVADATFLQVQKVADPDKYIARVHGVCHDADLALLTVERSSFMDGIKLAEIGELPNLRDPISVVGYPIGGEEISVTEGVVSRIEVQRYSHSQRELLAVTVDAAINDGNSGGPVLKDGRVAGIAFQSLGNAENIGEMVPAPLIERFLAGIEAGRQLDVPGLGVQIQTLENPTLRQFLGLDEHCTGVLVRSIDYLGSARGAIQCGDVLQSIDGNAISNNGTIRYRQRFRSSFDVILGELFIGDALTLGIWRTGKKLDVTLELKPHNWLVPRSQYDRSPTWFIYSGLVFQQLSLDYLRTWTDWWDKAPSEFLYHYGWGMRTRERQEVVLLTQILADEVNVGYEGLQNEVIVSVNGHSPVDMGDFVRHVDTCTGHLELKTSSGFTLVLDTSSSKVASKRILSHYHIGQDRSADLNRVRSSSSGVRASDQGKK